MTKIIYNHDKKLQDNLNQESKETKKHVIVGLRLNEEKT